MVVTFVTAFVELAVKRKSRPELMSFARAGVLALPHPLVIYLQPELVPEVLEFRSRLGLAGLTRVIPTALQDIPTYAYYRDVQRCREARHHEGMSLDKDTVEYALVTNSKALWLQQVAEQNPYGTSHFGWIDFGIAHIARRGLPHPLRLPSGRLRILCIRPLLPRELEKELCPPHCYAGGCVIGPADAIRFFAACCVAHFEDLLGLGWAPNEEVVWARVASLHPERFACDYGHYEGVLSNLAGVRENLDYLAWLLGFLESHRAELESHFMRLRMLLCRSFMDGWIERLELGWRELLLGESFAELHANDERDQALLVPVAERTHPCHRFA
jgi:hypothetical protein